mmetsp:Transcript_30713/g.86845  ORF Transcript_30713/g.86845 Transcript_30713/m.86845 type:complete len:117 (+) Transcript_30713:710-1060(+)
MLLEAATEAGIETAAADAFMDSDEGVAEIRKSQELLRRMGVHSIPTFIIQGQFLMNGALHSAEMVEIFRDIERKGIEGEPRFAGVLNIPEQRVAEGLQMTAWDDKGERRGSCCSAG